MKHPAPLPAAALLVAALAGVVSLFSCLRIGGTARVQAQGASETALQDTFPATPTTGESPPVDPAPGMEFIFEEIVRLGGRIAVGQTPLGRRGIVPIAGGTFAGPRLKGKILSGGWDWQLTAPGGCTYIKADYMLQTDDGAVINVINQGAICSALNAKGARIFTSPRFEAPNGRYEWLNRGAFIGTIQAVPGDSASIRILFYMAK